MSHNRKTNTIEQIIRVFDPIYEKAKSHSKTHDISSLVVMCTNGYDKADPQQVITQSGTMVCSKKHLQHLLINALAVLSGAAEQNDDVVTALELSRVMDIFSKRWEIAEVDTFKRDA